MSAQEKEVVINCNSTLNRSGEERKAMRTPGWLVALFIAVVLGDLFLVYRHESSGQLGITMVCWMAVWMLLSRRPLKPSGRSVAGLVIGGGLFVALAFLVFNHPTDWRSLLAVYPLWAGVALSLLAEGLYGPGRRWRELLILFFLGIPHGFLISWIDLSETTARFAGFLLHYIGREVRLTGTEIALPGGAVEVVKSCDGTGAMAYLACLAVIFLVLFPLKRWQRVGMVPLAMTIAFLTNAVRVALLAVIESTGGRRSFDFWHEGTGALLWTGLPVVIFGLVCFLVLHFQMRSTEWPPRPIAGADSEQ